ncbi:MAG TPA: pyridoxamine 5'-phosphate oxidase [Saprospiraceae bacterium]|nr:pyridoxamine 5'-phosphate oxidase [Saprospiraceae bacterium]HMQ81382.1 pyridoxamine 5'-phosphate oxidase [Saprospiraceae bacterium]
MLLNINDLRAEYSNQKMDKGDLSSNPFEQFSRWFKEAVTAQIPEPNAFTLASINTSGLPSARVVLLKELNEKGFVFFTNYNSRKAKDFEYNPHAAMVFSWLELQRQIRVEGTVEKISTQESEAYFQSRPKGSQIGAWASPQSQIVENRELLDAAVEKLSQQYADADHLPLPPFWGGYLIKPNRLEFWQGRTSRLHDRFEYLLEAENTWKIQRLAP